MNNLFLSFASTGDLEGTINSFSIRAIGIATIVLISLLLIAGHVNTKKKHKALKKPLFIAIALTIIVPTLMLISTTVFVNVKSESKGPVHWHTDIEYWVCGQEIEIRDPYQFLSNKVGTSTYHEHDDKRIHLEGVVIEKAIDASLDKFMAVTGGAISDSELTIPTNDDIFENDTDGDANTGDKELVEGFKQKDADGRTVLSMQNGASCGSSTQRNTEVQTFLLRYEKDDDTYTQTKLDSPGEYIMRDESIVPPGDCVIVEFDVAKSRTDKLCQQYGVRDSQRCTEFGVSEFNPKLCNITESKTTGGTQ